MTLMPPRDEPDNSVGKNGFQNGRCLCQKKKGQGNFEHKKRKKVIV